MASQAVKAAKALYAQPAFVPKGPINSGRFNLIREIAIGTTLGIAAGFVWKVGCWLNLRWEPGPERHLVLESVHLTSAKRGPTLLISLKHLFACFVQSWHWGEKRRLANYYSELYKKEKADEDAYAAELRGKLQALEDELLA
jgi:hypothetical protein